MLAEAISRILASRALSYRQRYVLALIRTVSGSLSLFASLIILYKIAKRYKQTRNAAVRGSLRNLKTNNGNNTYYRMLFSVSVLDVMHSFWSALSVLPAPPSSGGVFAYGTTATCSAQAFFAQLTTSIVLYMALLNTYFMLKIRYNVSDAKIEKYYEPWFHAIPILFWFVTGIAGLSLKIFNAIGLPELGCWIAPYPAGCTYTNTCTRGYRIAELLDWYAWIFTYAWLFVCVAVVLVNGCLIYTAIRKQEQRNATYLAAKLQMDSGGASGTNVTSTTASNLLCSLPEFGFLDDEPADDEPKEEVPKGRETGDLVNRETVEPQSLGQTGDLVHRPVVAEPLSLTQIGDSVNRPDVVEPKALAPPEIKPDASTRVPRRTERVNARRIRQSRTAAVQSSLYLCSALFTAVWIFLPWMGNKLLVEARVRFFFAFMVNIVSPSQGVFNLFIFVRLHYLHLRETHRDWSRLHCVYHSLFSSD